MDKLRQAASQALEVLEQHTAIKHIQQIPYRDSAIDALREALAESEQDPVGEVLNERGEVDWISFVPSAGTNLYTAPPQRKPLTDDFILNEVLSLGTAEFTAICGPREILKFARAIEAAHGIGEKK